MKHAPLGWTCPEGRLRAPRLPQLPGADEAARRGEEPREYHPLPGCRGRADRGREASPWGMPSRSPGRGPPYWKSRVLRRQALGDEGEREAWPRATAGTTAARASAQPGLGPRGSVTSEGENAGCTARWRSLPTARVSRSEQPPDAAPGRARGRLREGRPSTTAARGHANSLANRACFTYAPDFILANMEPILVEWEAFARSSSSSSLD